MSARLPFVTLPSAEEIMTRLAKVESDPYMQEHFCTLIAKDAGQERNAMGIVMMFTLKIHDFMKQGYPPIMGSLLHSNIPDYIDALVDDREIAEEAKSFYQQVLDEMNS